MWWNSHDNLTIYAPAPYLFTIIIIISAGCNMKFDLPIKIRFCDLDGTINRPQDCTCMSGDKLKVSVYIVSSFSYTRMRY